jgi:hypothetical protein
MDVDERLFMDEFILMAFSAAQESPVICMHGTLKW